MNTGQRTDIPAFYWPWFCNRLREGYVLVRNPYYPKIVTRYEINPEVIDLISFCTKNPTPAFNQMELLKPYHQYWFVSITPYGHDIEPNVPDKWKVMDTFRQLSLKVGKGNIAWRYDPVFLFGRYTVEYHLRAFQKMCAYLEGYTNVCVISFIDLYEKTKKNFPGIQQVSAKDQILLISEFVHIAEKHHILIRSCHEGDWMERYGVDTKGCFRRETAEEAAGELQVPAGSMARAGCRCLLGGDIGAYNTCLHGCLYCYANYDMNLVRKNHALHDSSSPLLIGHLQEEDELRQAEQKSWRNRQMRLIL